MPAISEEITESMDSHMARLERAMEMLWERMDNLEKENQRLKEELAESQHRAQTLELEKDYLIVSHKLADNPQALADTRRRLANLTTRLDRAIRLIKNDPADI